MEIKSTLFCQRKLKYKSPRGLRCFLTLVFLGNVIFGFAGCQTGLFDRRQTNNDSGSIDGHQTSPSEDSEDGSLGESDPVSVHVEAAPTEGSFVVKRTPKLGLILGGGGVLTYGQIGVLQELHRQKIPVEAIVGLEWGALVAGAYSLNGKVHEVEWQLLKMPHQNFSKKSMFGKKSPVNVEAFSKYLTSVFKGRTFQSSEIPFSCPYLDTEKKKTRMASRGPIGKALQFCWPALPSFQITKRMANPMGYGGAVQFLKDKGVELILFVDVLGKNEIFPKNEADFDVAAQLYWLQAQSSVEGLFDLSNQEVLSIPLAGATTVDFSDMRAIIRMGQLKSRALIQEFAKKYGY